MATTSIVSTSHGATGAGIPRIKRTYTDRALLQAIEADECLTFKWIIERIMKKKGFEDPALYVIDGGLTVLMSAIASGSLTVVLYLHAKYKLNLDTRAPDEGSLLRWACIHNQTPMLKLLLGLSTAGINDFHYDGYNVLLHMMEKRNAKDVEFVLEKGAKIQTAMKSRIWQDVYTYSGPAIQVVVDCNDVHELL
jgi:hypothetical protein